MEVLALTRDGKMTTCKAPPERRGIGRCNHVAHQRDNETRPEFTKRVNDMMQELVAGNLSSVAEDGDTMKLEPYRISDEEAATMKKIEANKDFLDKSDNEWYIEVEDQALWNDMDVSAYSQSSGMPAKNIYAVLHKDASFVTESDNPDYPVGKLVMHPDKDQPQIEGVTLATGVKAMNDHAKEDNFEATKRIFVLPYYMRQNSENDDEHVYTRAYKYIHRNRNDPDKQQGAYENLLNNSAATNKNPAKTKGFKNKSLADEFSGKKGIFRSEMSGRNIPYTGRAVITPNENLAYDEIAVPCAAAVDIFEPTLRDQFREEGKSEKEFQEYKQSFRRPQYEISANEALELAKRLDRGNVRAIMNRQPSLHYSSMQSYRVKISLSGGKHSGAVDSNNTSAVGNATCQVNPLTCASYASDFDGDTVTIVGVNKNKNYENIIDTVDSELGAKNPMNTQLPRAMNKTNIAPSKDAMWGLRNLLASRE